MDPVRSSGRSPARSPGRSPARDPGRGPAREVRAGGRPPRRRTLDDLRPLVRQGRYRIAPHAARHAACEGFTEKDVVAAVLRGRELARYLEDERLLALGWIRPSAEVAIPLHVVLEFRKTRWVDVVTAFVPDDPHRVASRARLAELLRWDGAEPGVRIAGRGASPRSGRRG